MVWLSKHPTTGRDRSPLARAYFWASILLSPIDGHLERRNRAGGRISVRAAVIGIR